MIIDGVLLKQNFRQRGEYYWAGYQFTIPDVLVQPDCLERINLAALHHQAQTIIGRR